MNRKVVNEKMIKVNEAINANTAELAKAESGCQAIKDQILFQKGALAALNELLSENPHICEDTVEYDDTKDEVKDNDSNNFSNVEYNKE